MNFTPAMKNTRKLVKNGDPGNLILQMPQCFRRALLNKVKIQNHYLVLKSLYESGKYFLCKFEGCISTNLLYEKLNNDEANKKKFKHANYLRLIMLPKLEKLGKIERGRAIDKPNFKHSGWKIVLNRAFDREFPCLISKLNPIPLYLKKDYIMHLFIYKTNDEVFNLYPKDKHRILNKINEELQLYLDLYRPAFDLTICEQEELRKHEEKTGKKYVLTKKKLTTPPMKVIKENLFGKEDRDIDISEYLKESLKSNFNHTGGFSLYPQNEPFEKFHDKNY